MFLSSDKPETPVLTANPPNPTYGQSVTLTCASSTEGVTDFKFFQGQSSLTATGTGNTYTISNATDVRPNGVQYTCQAIIDSVPSDHSSVLALNGKFIGTPLWYYKSLLLKFKLHLVEIIVAERLSG